MKAYLVTFGASTLSGFAFLGCIVAMLSIHYNVQGIFEELEGEMMEFKAITNDLWMDMLRIGEKTQFRRKRDAGYDVGGSTTGSTTGQTAGSTAGSTSGDSTHGKEPASKVPKLVGVGAPATPNGVSPPAPNGPRFVDFYRQ